MEEFIKGKVVHFYKGPEMIGSKASVNSRDAEIEIYTWGVRVTSKKTKRIVHIWGSNIVAAEAMPALGDAIPAPAKRGRPFGS